MSVKFEFDQSSPGYASSDRRVAAQRAEQDRADSRLRELESQVSPEHGPQMRIHIWEKLHALRLPSSPAHPLVGVIAAQTHLDVRDIREEQRRRRALTESSKGVA
jgi:hypothetical protein